MNNQINQTKEEAIAIFNDFLIEFGIEPLSEAELRDFEIKGGETNSQLREWAKDYANEISTERCESRIRYEY